MRQAHSVKILQPLGKPAHRFLRPGTFFTFRAFTKHNLHPRGFHNLEQGIQ